VGDDVAQIIYRFNGKSRLFSECAGFKRGLRVVDAAGVDEIDDYAATL
jgi:hypothetical protein